MKIPSDRPIPLGSVVRLLNDPTMDWINLGNHRVGIVTGTHGNHHCQLYALDRKTPICRGLWIPIVFITEIDVFLTKAMKVNQENAK